VPSPSVPMLADPRRSLRVAGVLLSVGVTVCLVVWVRATGDQVQWLDDQFLNLMERLRNPPATALAKLLAFTGGAVCTWTLRAVVTIVLVKRRHWVHLTAFACAVVTSEAMIGILKALYDRPRPVGALIGTTSSSFPSGHAVAAAVTAVGVVIALLPAGHERWVWERRAAVYASLMALSRTYLGAHWLSDVLAGGALGAALAVGWPALLVLERRSVMSHVRRPPTDDRN
jgi:membrane-associated phospholipid phosphatase